MILPCGDDLVDFVVMAVFKVSLGSGSGDAGILGGIELDSCEEGSTKCPVVVLGRVWSLDAWCFEIDVVVVGARESSAIGSTPLLADAAVVVVARCRSCLLLR